MPAANHFASQTDHLFFTDSQLETQLEQECWLSGAAEGVEMFHWAYVSPRFCILFLDVNHSAATQTRDDEIWLLVLFSLEPVDLDALRAATKKIKDFRWVLGGGTYLTSNSAVHNLYFPAVDGQTEPPIALRTTFGNLTPPKLMEYLSSKAADNSLSGRLSNTLVKILNDPEEAILHGNEEIPAYAFSYPGGYHFSIASFMYFPAETRKAFASTGLSYDNIPLAEYFFNLHPLELNILPHLPDAQALPFRLPMGKSQQLAYNATYRGSAYLTHLANVRWESSRPNVVDVDANGRLSALSPGEAIISLLADDDNLSQADNGTHRITGHVVVPFVAQQEDYYISPRASIDNITHLKENTSITLTPVLPALSWNGSTASFDASFSWTSSDLSVVATATANSYPAALLSAAAAGNATVTLNISPTFPSSSFTQLHPDIPLTPDVISHYGFAPIRMTRQVEVSSLPPGYAQFFPPLAQGETGHTLYIGDSLLCTFLVWNEEPTISPFWLSTQPAVASVNNGMVKALAPGQTSIRVASYTSGWTPVIAERTVTVLLPQYYRLPDKILQQGQDAQLTVPSLTWNGITLPFTHSHWSSSAPAIVRVTSGGEATALNPGEALLSFVFSTAHSLEPVTFTQRILVPPFLRITPALTDGNLSTILAQGRSFQCYLEAMFNFTPYIFSNYRWTSSNPQVASISPYTGRVEALALGQTLLTVTVNGHAFGDSPLNASRMITVIHKPSVRILSGKPGELEMPEEDLSLPLYSSLQLSASGFWNEAAYLLDDPQWQSSHPDILAVDPNGLITALKLGSATITFTAHTSLYPVRITRQVVVSTH
jgi:uncharacterized protein YjdB